MPYPQDIIQIRCVSFCHLQGWIKISKSNIDFPNDRMSSDTYMHCAWDLAMASRRASIFNNRTTYLYSIPFIMPESHVGTDDGIFRLFIPTLYLLHVNLIFPLGVRPPCVHMRTKKKNLVW